MTHPGGARRMSAAGWVGLGAPLLIVALCGALAFAARHGLVEPAELTARCDTTPWLGIDCVLRSMIVQTFVEQRIGGVALALAVLATVTRWRALALAALGTGSAGVLLYSLDWAAPAVLLAALVLVRPRTMAPIGAAGAAR